MLIKILTVKFKAGKGMYPILQRKFIIKDECVVKNILDSMSSLYIISHSIEVKELKDYIELGE